MKKTYVPFIDQPGLYTLDHDTYHADPCVTPSLTSSIGKLLLFASPRHAYTEHPRLTPQAPKEESDKFDKGNAGHALLLHDDRKFAVHVGDSWRGNVGGMPSAKWKAEQRDEGLIPILADQLEETREMVDECRRLLPEAEASDAFDLDLGTTERTLVWQDDGGVWCRCKLDWIPNELKARRQNFYDYKTTRASAHPEAWQKTGYGFHVDLQAAFYCRGIKKVFGIEEPRMRFVVQEVYPPYELSVVELTPAAMEFASRKVERMITLWRLCMKKNQWPGYPTRIAYIQPPAYAEQEWLEREEKEPMDEAMLDRLIDWQHPL